MLKFFPQRKKLSIKLHPWSTLEISPLRFSLQDKRRKDEKWTDKKSAWQKPHLSYRAERKKNSSRRNLWSFSHLRLLILRAPCFVLCLITQNSLLLHILYCCARNKTTRRKFLRVTFARRIKRTKKDADAQRK